MISVRKNWFTDELNRVAMLRGVNLGGSSKVPYRPDGSSYRLEGFFDYRNVSFVGRPFPLEEADEHYHRLREWGFNCLRFLITWEALEHAGPGIYDEEYLDYLYQVVKKAGEFGFNVFIDPHQDVWSRFSGGDGAPGWTLECAGFDMRGFKCTGAAIVHQTYGDPFPKMVWPTNAYKLAAATMFTLFFAGNDFAPNTKVDGVPIQNFLQDHFLACMRRVAEKLKALEGLIGYDNFNEPQRGYVGIHDLRERYGELEMGVFPSPWQSIQLGSGFSQKVEILERGIFGPSVTGHVLLNQERASAWLPGRSCVWRENGVWDVDRFGNPILLKPDHFFMLKDEPVSFVQHHLLPFTRKFSEVIHSVDENSLIFVESEVEKSAPMWSDAADDKAVYAPHWYDGVSLIFKRFIPWLGVNIFTRKPVFGFRNIRNAYKKILGNIKAQAATHLGNIPVLIGEVGIPFDMDNKKAYQTGDYTSQNRAMDRSMRALEANLLNYTLWNYTADNINERGDRWNDEDLSIFSRDQQTNLSDIYSGGRGLSAVIRPYPVRTAGIPLSLTFDYRSGKLEFTFENDPEIAHPTEIFIPSLHYPNGIKVKAEKGEFHHDPSQQKLAYRSSVSGMHSIQIEPQ